jgi:AcrR family transcriptional regulator
VVAKTRASRTPARKPGIERYNRITESAESLIIENQSPEPLTLMAIADRAEVPRVSLYHFFDSVEALTDALYARGVEKMMAHVTELAESSDWRQLMTEALSKSRDFYNNNPVEMILALSPRSISKVVSLNKTIGRDVHALLVERANVSKAPKVGKCCEIAVDIADAVWRKSFFEHGKITPMYHREATAAVLLYLERVLAT